ncbi:hypothetical protein PENTCL1PPCAC_8492, partial [Pristionchus entomophagus]
ACQSIAQPSFPACMCQMPLIANGKRDGDKMCGSRSLYTWRDLNDSNFSPSKTPLTCTKNGWTSVRKRVEPNYVVCK